MSQFGSYSTAEQVLRDIDLSGKNVLITGSDSGIGFETALQIAKHKANVYACSLNEEFSKKGTTQLKSQSGSQKIFPVVFDLGDLLSIRKAVKELKGIKFDILFFNAGATSPQRRTTKDGFEKQFGVNHLGHFLLGNLLINQLNDNARVVCTASIAHWLYLKRGGMRWDDLMWEKIPYNERQVYAQSKLANILFAYKLNLRFIEKGIKASAYSVHPGLMDTNFHQEATPFERWYTSWFLYFCGKSVQQGAACQVYVGTAPEINPEKDGGFYFDNCQKATPTWHAQQPYVNENSERLWKISLDLVGLK